MTPSTRILVADDDPDLRDILRSILEPEGFEVVEAADGEAALKIISQHPPHLLILDCVMPRLDGLQVCQRLKQDLLLRHVPVIMLTGKGEIQDKVEGMATGVDDYQTKPFEPAELLARVRMVLRRTTQELEANPLTKLPGNISIEQELESRLQHHQPIAICYADLDRFKEFNDHYGFERGDQAITHTATVLLDAVARYGKPTDFIGHIGGDDFIILTSPDRADAICRHIIQAFDTGVIQLYDEDDRRRGYLRHRIRTGATQKMGFLRISIAVVTNTERVLTHLGQVAAIGAELKTYAKQFDKSLYVKDRRTLTAT